MSFSSSNQWFVPSLRLGACCGILLATLCVPSAKGQENGSDPSTPVATPTAIAPGTPAQPADKQDKRVFGVLPNYRTTDGTKAFAPITPKQKMMIATRDAFDYPGLLLAAGFAGIYQLQGTDPSLGQGVEGYFKRYGCALTDQIMSTELTEGVLPSLLHHDPRYFRLGRDGGTNWSRAKYALTRVFITKTDSGAPRFNISEIGGTAASVAISNLYYPDSRNVEDNAEKFGIQVGSDALGNVLKEFWPDVKQWYIARHHKQDQNSVPVSAPQAPPGAPASTP